MNKSQSSDRNTNFRLLIKRVINHVRRNGYVIFNDRFALDHVILANSSLIVANTFNNYGNRTFVDKIGSNFSASLKGNGIFFIHYQCQTSNSNNNVGLLSNRVIDHVGRNGYVIINNRFALDHVILANSTCVVTNTFNRDGNRTCVGKVGGNFSASLKGNCVISALNKCQGSDRNTNFRLLIKRVVNHVGRNGYIFFKNLCLVDCVVNVEHTLIVTNTLYNKRDCAETFKVGCINTFSSEDIEIVYTLSENFAIYSNNDFGNLVFSVVKEFDILIGSVKSKVTERNIYVFRFNPYRIDVINQCNLTFVVTHSFDHCVNFACVGKVSGFFHNTVCINSAEFNSIIRAFNRVKPRAVKQSGNC